MKMSVLRVAVVGAGQGQDARAVNRGEVITVETLQGPPDRRLYVRTAPAGATTLAIAEGTGWMKSPQRSAAMNPAAMEQVMGEWRAALDLGRELDVAKRLSAARTRRDAIDGKAMWVLAGPAPGGPQGATERLWFDAATGLLARRTVLRPTQIGLDPEQTDYADYRPVDGVLLPFRITTSYLDDNHLGVTRILASVKNNVAVDPKAFEAPK